MPASHQSEESRKQLMSLLLKHQRRVFGFILTLVQNRADAEDLMQETSMILWEKFNDFDPDTDFIAWASRIAFFCVKNYRRCQGRAKVLFTDNVLDEIADRANALGDEIDLRHELLRSCLSELPERSRTMLLARYAPHGSVSKAAQVAQSTVATTYKSLSRLRRGLQIGITRKLLAEEQL